MVGDRVELHEGREHQRGHGVHLQGFEDQEEEEAVALITNWEGAIVKRPNNPMSPQYLKPIKPVFWDQCPPLMKVPYQIQTTPGNTLMVDDSPAKTFSNPTGTVIICPSWTVEKVRYKPKVVAHMWFYSKTSFL